MQWFMWVNLILGLYMFWMFCTSFLKKEKYEYRLWRGLKHWGWKIGYGIVGIINVGAFMINFYRYNF